MKMILPPMARCGDSVRYISADSTYETRDVLCIKHEGGLSTG